MSDLSDYRTPTPPGRELEPIVIVLSEDETETISPKIFSCSTVEIQRDYAEFYDIPNASSLPSEEIFRLLLSENLAIPLHPRHILINGVVGQQVVRREDVESPEDADPRQLEQHGAEIRSSPVRDAAHRHVPIERLSTPDDGGPEGEAPDQDQPKSPNSRPHREPSIPPLQDCVDADGRHSEPHSPNLFQNLFERLRDQHNDLRTQIHQVKTTVRDTAADVLEASALFKAEEAELQEVLTRVRNIVGPRVAKWIDEDVAASMETGKLVCRDLSALDAAFNRSDDEDDESSKPKRGDGEGHDEGAGHTSSDRKGKRKAKDNNQSYRSNDSRNGGRTEGNTKASGSRTRSGQRKRSAERQADGNTDRQKRSRISPAISARSSSSAAPSPIPEKPSSPLKRARDSDDGSEDEVEKSITMHRSLSSILEASSPVNKKARRQGSHVSDISVSSMSGSSTSPGNKSHGPSVSSQTGMNNNHAGPSTSSHSTTGRLFPPTSFPRFRPPETPERPHELRAKPLQRDTYRVRANPDTGEFEVFDYELTQEYKERLQRDRYDIHIQVPMVCDFKTDLQTMSELDGPPFKFDRDAWRNFEDHT